MAIVRMPIALRQLADGARQVEVPATTVEELLAALEARHPGLRERLCEPTGELRPFISLYVGHDDVRLSDGLSTRLRPDDVVTIVPAMSGGAGVQYRLRHVPSGRQVVRLREEVARREFTSTVGFRACYNTPWCLRQRRTDPEGSRAKTCR